MITIQLINEISTVNNLSEISNIQYVAGDTFKIRFQIGDSILNHRLMIDPSGVVEVSLNKTDGTILTKTATKPFAQDDSIFEIGIDATESTEIASSSFAVKIDFLGDGSEIKQTSLGNVLVFTTDAVNGGC